MTSRTPSPTSSSYRSSSASPQPPLHPSSHSLLSILTDQQQTKNGVDKQSKQGSRRTSFSSTANFMLPGNNYYKLEQAFNNIGPLGDPALDSFKEPLRNCLSLFTSLYSSIQKYSLSILQLTQQGAEVAQYCDKLMNENDRYPASLCRMLSFHSGRRAIHNIAQLFLGGSIGLTATSGLQDELFEPLWQWQNTFEQFIRELLRTQAASDEMTHAHVEYHLLLVEQAEKRNEQKEKELAQQHNDKDPSDTKHIDVDDVDVESEFEFRKLKSDVNSCCINYDERLKGLKLHFEELKKQLMECSETAIQRLLQQQQFIFQAWYDDGIDSIDSHVPPSRFEQDLMAQYRKVRKHTQVPETFHYHQTPIRRSSLQQQVAMRRLSVGSSSLVADESNSSSDENDKEEIEEEKMLHADKTEPNIISPPSLPIPLAPPAPPLAPSLIPAPPSLICSSSAPIAPPLTSNIPAAPPLAIIPTAPGIPGAPSAPVLSPPLVLTTRQREVQDAQQYKLRLLPDLIYSMEMDMDIEGKQTVNVDRTQFNAYLQEHKLKKLHWQNLSTAQIANTNMPNVWKELFVDNSKETNNDSSAFHPLLSIDAPDNPNDPNPYVWCWKLSAREFVPLFLQQQKKVMAKKKTNGNERRASTNRRLSQQPIPGSSPLSSADSDSTPVSSPAADGNTPIAPITFVSAKRAHILGILLTKLKFNPQQLRSAILHVDEHILGDSDSDMLESVKRIWPNEEEIALIQQYKAAPPAATTRYGTIEHFFIEFYSADLWPRYQLCIFYSTFTHQCSKLEDTIQCVSTALHSLLDSISWKQFLSIVLRIANVLQRACAQPAPQAYGFVLISTLQQLAMLKSSDGTANTAETLLHYIVRYVRKVCPEAKNWVDEFETFRAACRIEQSYVHGEIQRLKQALQQCQQLVEKDQQYKQAHGISSSSVDITPPHLNQISSKSRIVRSNDIPAGQLPTSKADTTRPNTASEDSSSIVPAAATIPPVVSSPSGYVCLPDKMCDFYHYAETRMKQLQTSYTQLQELYTYVQSYYLLDASTSTSSVASSSTPWHILLSNLLQFRSEFCAAEQDIVRKSENVEKQQRSQQIQHDLRSPPSAINVSAAPRRSVDTGHKIKPAN